MGINQPAAMVGRSKKPSMVHQETCAKLCGGTAAIVSAVTERMMRRDGLIVEGSETIGDMLARIKPAQLTATGRATGQYRLQKQEEARERKNERERKRKAARRESLPTLRE